jgi:hypothetical protein
MDTNVMYCAEQIKIPTELGAVMKHYTKALILSHPKNLYKWSANYFAQLAMLPPVFGANGEYLDDPQSGRGKAPPSVAAPSDPPSRGTSAATNQAVSPQSPASVEQDVDPQQGELVAQIFTNYNTESGYISQADVLSLFADLKSQLGFELEPELQQQYLQYLTPDENGNFNLQDVYMLFFQQEEQVPETQEGGAES